MFSGCTSYAVARTLLLLGLVQVELPPRRVLVLVLVLHPLVWQKQLNQVGQPLFELLRFQI